MQKRISACALALLAVASVLSVTGCGGGGGGGTETVKTLTFSPTSASVPAGEISSFSLAVTFSNPTNSNGTTPVITYLVNGVAGGTVATGTITPSTNDALVGQYTAPMDLSGSRGKHSDDYGDDSANAGIDDRYHDHHFEQRGGDADCGRRAERESDDGTGSGGIDVSVWCDF